MLQEDGTVGNQGDPGSRWRSGMSDAMADGVLSVLFDAVLQRADAGVLVLDADLRFVLVNETAAQLHGVAPADHVGRWLGDVTPLALGLEPLFRDVLATGRPRLELELRTPDGPEPAAGRWFRSSVVRVVPPDRPDEPLVASIFTDITEQRREADMLARLAQLSGALTAAESTDDVAMVVLGSSDLVDDALFVTLALHDPERRALRIRMPPGLDPAVPAPWVQRPLDGSRRTPITDAFERSEPVFVASAEEAEAQYPELAGESRHLGIVATVAIPLLDAAGTTFGVIGAGWAEAFDPSPELQSRLHVFADLCSQALQRARRSDAHAELVRHLQEELIGPVDPIDELDLAVAYRPAGGALGIGGDWYDVVALDGGCTAIIVGDVVGHGVEAAAQMAQAKGVVRALTLGSTTLGSVFAGATRSLRHLDSSYVATAAIARVDPSVRELSWTTAGHLPPLLAEPGTEPELLWSPVQPPIGMAASTVDPPVRTYRPGSLLVLYTDGLVERRGESIDERLDLFGRVVRELGAAVGAAEARDRIVAAMVGQATEDDVAIVVARLD